MVVVANRKLKIDNVETYPLGFSEELLRKCGIDEADQLLVEDVRLMVYDNPFPHIPNTIYTSSLHLFINRDYSKPSLPLHLVMSYAGHHRKINSIPPVVIAYAVYHRQKKIAFHVFSLHTRVVTDKK